MTFRKFVNEQVARLTSFEEFNRLPDAGKKEFSDLLFDLAKEPEPKRDRAAVDWMDSQSARNVKAIVEEGLEFQKHPTLADLRNMWKRLITAPAQAMRESCHRCHGSGFVSVEGPYGLSSAYPCTHQPETESDCRMGLRMTPTQAKRYMDEAAESDKRHVAWLQHREKSGDDRQFHRVTQADVDNLIAHLPVGLGNMADEPSFSCSHLCEATEQLIAIAVPGEKQ